jgi:hypothetical protein
MPEQMLIQPVNTEKLAIALNNNVDEPLLKCLCFVMGFDKHDLAVPILVRRNLQRMC